jgi:hypothetical protein
MAGYVLVKCPHCRKPVDAHVGIHSGLGSPVLACWWCGGTYRTNRSEWQDREAPGKLWYLLISLVYVAVGGLLGGITLAGAAHVAQHPGEAKFRLGEHLIAFSAGFLLWAMLLTLFQLYRIYASVRRGNSRKNRPLRMPPWGSQALLQVKFIGAMFLVAAGTWVALAVFYLVAGP